MSTPQAEDDSPGPVQRRILWTYGLNKGGTGVFASLLVIYLTTQRDIDPAALALAMLAAGIAGTAAGIPLGNVADRLGPRAVYMTTLGFEAVASVVIIFAFNNLIVLVALLLAEVGAAASAAAAAPLVRTHGGARPAVFRARVRTVSNMAMAGGAGIAALVALFNEESFYITALGLNTLSFLAAILLVRKLPELIREKPQPQTDSAHTGSADAANRGPGPRSAMTDLPYLVAALVNGVLGLHTAFLTFIIPLAMVRLDPGYAWIGPAALAFNTLAIFLFQVRVSRRIGTNAAAGRAFLASGVLVAVAIALLAWVSRAEPSLSTLLAVLLGIVVVYAFAEMYSAAGGFEVAFGLAPRSAQGQYFGTFNALFHLGIAIGPALLGWLFFMPNPAGPIILVAFFILWGVLSPLLIRWADTRTHLNGTDE